MNKEDNIPVITDREKLYDKCENMEQLFDKYYLPLLDKHYSKTYKLQQELADYKQRNEKAIEYLHEYCEIELGQLTIYGDNINPCELEKILLDKKDKE